MYPENGYESPQSRDEAIFFGQGEPTDAASEGRRRTAFAGSDDNTLVDKNENNTSSEAGNDETSMQDGEREEPVDEEGGKKKIGFRDRISCYTWTWFTLTMATGGIANVLHTVPYQSKWLRVIGTIIFLFNVLLFLLNCFFITLRFKWNPGSLKASFTSPSESLFIPAAVVTLGTMFTNMAQYGIPHTGPWFQTVMQVLFWSYASISFIASSGMYLIIWSTQTFPIHTMTPIWIFPAYPALMLAPMASSIISALPDAAAAQRINATAIAFGAVTIQGTGYMVSLMIYSAFIYRLMTQKLPRESTRPGMFVSVGPSGFTVAGLVGLGSNLNKILPDGYQGNADATSILELLSLMVGLWIWGLCLWFFLVSIGAHWSVMKPYDEKHHIHFDMTWYSFVFPNTALITATFAIGKALESKAIRIFGTVLSVLIVGLWLFIFFMMIRSLVFNRILWPGEIDGSEISWRKWMGKIENITKAHKSKEDRNGSRAGGMIPIGGR
ncbi:voltage-dependent anion channel-domain-containing protein [Amylocarpus encephaloides]|uniref:Voltage-dependent anion channel-domain-containing protein n=1 Tax=Amylocarpus encephaloides TaxID=45428 RepID=A0A9P7Y8C9_9HELO|nr:voltage-dependent anion channel-domain-containing protein [Amylocarpus encephaloides]